MKITRVRTHLLSADWAAIDPQWGGDLGTYRSSALVRVETDAGISGLGEVILGYFAPEAVPALVEYYQPHLAGQDPTQTAPLWNRMYESSKWWGRSGAALSVIAGIDTALWDLKGKILDVPVHTLLGGCLRPRQRVYASVGGCPWPLDATVAHVRRWVDAGFTAVKIGQFYDHQFHYHPIHGVSIDRPATTNLAAQEAEKFDRLRRELGPHIDLILHNHMGSQAPGAMNLNEAARVLQAVEPFGLLFAEEPLPYEDLSGYAMLRQRTTTPIAGGEMLSGRHEFAQFLRAEALDIVQPDVSFVGGITTCWEVMNLASAHHVRTALHMGGSFGPAFAAGLHLSLAHRDAFILEFLPTAAGAMRDICRFPIDLVEGAIAAPTLPGLGVELSDETLARYPFVPGSGERG